MPRKRIPTYFNSLGPFNDCFSILFYAQPLSIREKVAVGCYRLVLRQKSQLASPGLHPA